MAPASPVIVRAERPGDEIAIERIERAAFDGPAEARIVALSRGTADWDPARSLVAEDADGRIVGHLLLSRCAVVDEGGEELGVVLAAGPVAVEPARQRQGIGSALMRAAIATATTLGAPALVLLGHPAYYPRFGFGSARALGLLPPGRWSDEAWMARALPAWSSELRGLVRFPETFGPL